MSRAGPSFSDYADLVWVTITNLVPSGTIVSVSVIATGVEAVINGKPCIFTEDELKANAKSAKSFIRLVNSKIAL